MTLWDNLSRPGRAKCRKVFVRRLAATVFVALLSVAFAQCSLEPPSAPKWDADLIVPLISKTYTLSELVDDEDALFIGDDGLVQFEFEEDLDRFYVGDRLKIDPIQEGYDFVLGDFGVEEPAPQQVGVALEEIYPESKALSGQEVPVPPFQFAPAPIPLTPFEEFGYVVLEHAEIAIRLDNNLPIPLGPPLLVELRDGATDTSITSVSYDQTVAPGGFFTEVVQLDHRRLSNALSIRVEGSSPGSATPVPIDPQASFRITSQIRNIAVSEAAARVPSQHLVGSETAVVEDSIVVTEAVIQSGTIHLDLGGIFPLNGLLSFRFPDFVDPEGHSLDGQLYLTRNGSNQIDVDLSGYRLVPEAAPMTQQKVRFDWSFDSEGSGSQIILVKSTDFVHADLSVSELKFSEISGTIAGQTIEIEQQSFKFDIPAELDSVVLETGRLELTINNAINFPAETDIVVEGDDGSGSPLDIEIRETIHPASASGVPTTTTLVLDTNNQQVAAFLNALPKLIRVFGSVVVGDEQWHGRITADDFVDGKVRFTAPLALSLPAQSLNENLDQIDIDEDVRKEIRERVISGQLVAEIENHLPVGATAELYFGNVDSLVFEQPGVVIGPLQVSQGQVEPASGEVAESTVSEVALDVTGDDLLRLLTAPLYAGVRIVTPGTDGDVVRVLPSDFVVVKAYAQIKLQVNFD